MGIQDMIGHGDAFGGRCRQERGPVPDTVLDIFLDASVSECPVVASMACFCSELSIAQRPY